MTVEELYDLLGELIQGNNGQLPIICQNGDVLEPTIGMNRDGERVLVL